MKTVEVTDEILEKINLLERTPLYKDDVFVFKCTIVDNDIDTDFESFSINSLYDLKDKFIGKTVIIDGSLFYINAREVRGKIFDTKIHISKNKRTLNNEPLVKLKILFYVSTKSCSKNSLIKLTRTKSFTSISASFAESRCSICNKNVRNGKCSHSKGKIYTQLNTNNLHNNKICHYILDRPIEVYEVAIVNKTEFNE